MLCQVAFKYRCIGAPDGALWHQGGFWAEPLTPLPSREGSTHLSPGSRAPKPIYLSFPGSRRGWRDAWLLHGLLAFLPQQMSNVPTLDKTHILMFADHHIPHQDHCDPGTGEVQKKTRQDVWSKYLHKDLRFLRILRYCDPTMWSFQMFPALGCGTVYCQVVLLQVRLTCICWSTSSLGQGTSCVFSSASEKRASIGHLTMTMIFQFLQLWLKMGWAVTVGL